MGVTQTDLATAIGVTQGNVSFYERGATVPPKVAGRLISYARSRGVHISFDTLYSSHLSELVPPHQQEHRNAA